MVDTPMVLCGNAWKPLKSWAVYFQQNKEKILSNVPFIPDVNIFRSEKELGKKVALIKGDITKLKVDAVVNAANRPLRGGGGVDGAIHKAAGTQQLLSETKKLYPQGCLPGNAVITKGFNLPAKNIIHTVGPMDKDDETLMSCYHNCFKLCVKHKLRSIAFCCIATGIYGFPNDRAAQIAVSCARAVLEMYSEKFDQIVFCVFMDQDEEFYQQCLTCYFPVGDSTDASSDSSDREKAKEESPIKYYNLAKKRLTEEEDEWSSGRDIPHSFTTAEEENGRAELGERASPLGAEDTNERSNFEDKRPEPTGEESGQKMVATSSNEVVEEGILRPEPIGESAVADGMVLNIPVGPNGSANISPPESNEVNENIPKRIKED